MREHCGIAKEREAMLTKLPYGTVIYLLSFFYPAKSLGYFGKLIKLNSETSEMSIAYCMATIILYPLELLIMKSRLR